ncbi:MAG: hypothetical protein Q6363_004280 [Candidatus Njordarchaeota archaeon]
MKNRQIQIQKPKNIELKPVEELPEKKIDITPPPSARPLGD